MSLTFINDVNRISGFCGRSRMYWSKRHRCEWANEPDGFKQEKREAMNGIWFCDSLYFLLLVVYNVESCRYIVFCSYQAVSKPRIYIKMLAVVIEYDIRR